MCLHAHTPAYACAYSRECIMVCVYVYQSPNVLLNYFCQPICTLFILPYLIFKVPLSLLATQPPLAVLFTYLIAEKSSILIVCDTPDPSDSLRVAALSSESSQCSVLFGLENLSMTSFSLDSRFCTSRSTRSRGCAHREQSLVNVYMIIDIGYAYSSSVQYPIRIQSLKMDLICWTSKGQGSKDRMRSLIPT